jgi:hypothetical protein
MDKIKSMKALSIAQPWAECIVGRGKNVENRTWNTKYRGYFALHASAAITNARLDDCYEAYGIRFSKEKLASGSVVGIARLQSVITEAEVNRLTKRWFEGEFGLVLTDVIRLPHPVPVKGALSFWKLSGRPLQKVLEQLTAAQRKRIARDLLAK